MLLSFYVIFSQFQRGIAHKSVAYKKKRVAGWQLYERDIIVDFLF